MRYIFLGYLFDNNGTKLSKVIYDNELGITLYQSY